MKTNERLYFIDNLRGFIVAMVIVLHVALCYMAFAPEWWYVLNPERSFACTIIVILTDVFVMPIMFFCAGYFTFVSLRKKGGASFWRDKHIRITLPWIFGVLVMAPLIAYSIYYTRKIPVSLGQFWMHDFWGNMFQQAHYWFLGMLLVFFLIAHLGAKLMPSIIKKETNVRKPSIVLPIGFIGLTAVAGLVMNQFVPQDYWYKNTYVLVFQPVRVFGLLAYFLLGIYAEKVSWFTEQGYKPSRISWSVLLVVSGALYVLYKLAVPEAKQVTLALQAGSAITFNFFCFSSLLAFLALFQKLCNKTTPLLSNFSSCSYAIYYVHQFFVISIIYACIPIQLPVLIKFIGVTIAATLLSWGVANLMKRAPLLKNMF